MRLTHAAGLCLTAISTAAASPALAQSLTPVGIFIDAGIVSKLVIVSLLGAMIAALVICGLKVAAGPNLTGGSAFLSGLRLGGPLVGCLGAVYAGLMISIGIATAATPPPMKAIAPGLAEAMFVLGLGLLTGVVGVLANWLVEARIDRAVLRP